MPGTSIVSAAQPTSAIGGGDFEAIINAACDVWENTFNDDHTLTLYFAWAQTNSGRAEHYGHAFSEDPVRETRGVVLFDSRQDGLYRFYLDPTPQVSEEYRLYQERERDYGGGLMVVERRFFAATGDAASTDHHDLLTVAIHEIGHALGMSYSNSAFTAIQSSGKIVVRAPRPFPGSELLLFENEPGEFTSHFAANFYEYFVLGGYNDTPAQRSIPTEVDIVGLAELSSFNIPVLSPHPVNWTFEQGLIADYYYNESPFDNGPLIDLPYGEIHGRVDQINFPATEDPWPRLDLRFTENWGAFFSGWIKIDTPGIYTFTAENDGGTQFAISDTYRINGDGSRIDFPFLISFSGGWHPDDLREEVYSFGLEEGYHQFVLAYGDNGGPSGFVLYWSGPGFEKEIVPDSAFWHTAWSDGVSSRPYIVAQPHPLKLRSGESGNLIIETSGYPAPTYQWRKNGTKIPGATSSSLDFDNAQPRVSGIYDCVVSNEEGEVISDAVPLAVIGQQHARPTSLSVRNPAGVGDETLIVGFAIVGQPSAKKTMLIRAAGPALERFDVDGVLTDPALHVFDSNGIAIASNDDWDVSLTETFTKTGAFLWEEGSADAAILLELPRGLYTVHVENREGSPREALVEIYDVSRDMETSLVGLSSRMIEQPGNTLIAGITIDGPGTAVFRHSGPALGPLGVANVASDPTIRVLSGSRSIRFNNNWQAGLRKAFEAVGLFGWETGSSDAAVVIATPSGSYTVHCTVEGTSGVGLCEVYAVPE